MKSKQTLKWKYTRKQWLKKYYELPNNSIINNLLKDLLAKSTPKKKSKEIKQEENITKEIITIALEKEFPDNINYFYEKWTDFIYNLFETIQKQENIMDKGGSPTVSSNTPTADVHLTPSLLNDIETIEEIEGMAIQTDGIQPEQVSNNDYFADLIGKLIKNQRILTEILNLLIKNK